MTNDGLTTCFDDFFSLLGTIHILRNHERGGRGLGQMLTFDYEGGGGV